MSKPINDYISAINKLYTGGRATELSYQPAQKWLKDRKGRALSTDDVMHYQKSSLR